MDYENLSFRWPGYSTIRIETDNGLVIYLDPGRTIFGVLADETPEDADYVLVSHTHHYDPVAIHRVSNADTVVYVFEDVVDLNNNVNQPKEELIPPRNLVYDVRIFEYEEDFRIDDIQVQTIPAYSRPSPEGLNVRGDGTPREKPGTNVGFHLTVDGTTVFWPSDSDFIKEHHEISADVVFAPISQVVTMNRLDAVDLVKTIEPQLVIPVHYKWKEKTPEGPTFLAADPYAFRDDVEAIGIRCEVI